MENQNFEVFPLERASRGVPRSTRVRPPGPAPRRDPSAATLGEVAHDLRGLLTVVKGYTDLLLEESERVASPSSEMFCRKILRACSLMQDLVDNCLDLSRIRAGRLAIRPQQVDLASFLEEAVDRQGPRARHKEITLMLDVRCPLPPVETDLAFLERILGNLLGNALKFSPRGSTVRLTARQVGPWVELEVDDQGPGLCPGDAPDLFEAFQSGSAVPTGGEKSTGLGLAIVKELAAAMGYSISVRSNESGGASFCVILPCG